MVFSLKQRTYSLQISGGMWFRSLRQLQQLLAHEPVGVDGVEEGLGEALWLGHEGPVPAADGALLSIAAHMSKVGTMSMIAAFITLSGWSRHMRWVVRPPRSWPAT